jgi:hypothetical protein
MGLSALVLKPTFTSRGPLVHEACHMELPGQGNVRRGRAQVEARSMRLVGPLVQDVERTTGALLGFPEGG